jgi:ABC-2 type transport system ATP-binding protein
MYGVGGKDFRSRANEVLEIVGLTDRAKSLVKTFSGGMRRRLEIARGLLHYPKVLFLDEPTLGLDPQTRNAIWDYVRKLRKEHGMTILLTTHYMEEADNLCDRVAIIDHGKIIAIGSPKSLKDSLKGDSITITTADPEKFKIAVEKEKLSDCSSVHDGKVSFCVKDADKRLASIVAVAEHNKISIESVELHKPTLDDVFLHYTGKTIREENGTVLDSMRTRMKAWGRR